MTSVIIPEFIYDGIASAPAGQLLSGGFGTSGLCGGTVVQVEAVRTPSAYIKSGAAARFPIKAVPGGTSDGSVSSGSSASASGTALVELIVFQKCSADKE